MPRSPSASPFTLPDPFSLLPRYPLLYSTPSPIHPLQTLTSSLSHPPTPTAPTYSLYTKREDHSSPLATAGNKYRKLEYIVPDILHHSTTTLVTEGAIQSNHTIQVAAVARKLGLKSIVLLGKDVGGGLGAARDKDAFLRSGNVQVARVLGADVRFVGSEPDPDPGPGSTGIDRDDPAEMVLKEVRRKGEIPYWIPSGASLHPLGGLGYARGAFEIISQEEQADLGGSGRFDYIFVACGSGSTVGGLIAGFKLIEKLARRDGPSPRKVIGILNSPTKPREYHEGRVLDFARRAGALIGLEPGDISMDDVWLDDRFVGSAYGVLDPKTKQTLEMMARTEGVILDPVYTAKVFRGMMHYVQHNELVPPPSPSEHINALFIHTGGQSALGAYVDVD